MKTPRIGVFLSSMRPVTGEDYEAGLRRMAGMGFDGANVGFHSMLKCKPHDEQRRLLCDLPAELGIEISGMHSALSEGDSPDVAERARPLTDAVDIAAECDIPVVILHGGPRIGDDESENRTAWDRMVEELKYGCPYAAERNVKVGMEPGGGVWMVHGWRLLNRLRQEVGESFGVNYDPANVVMACEDPIRGVEMFGDAIVHMHLKDARIRKPAPNARAFVEKLDDIASKINFAEWRAAMVQDSANRENYWEETPVGEGDVDFKALLEALDRIGFDGWMAIEREGRRGADEQIASLEQAREHVMSLAAT